MNNTPYCPYCGEDSGLGYTHTCAAGTSEQASRGTARQQYLASMRPPEKTPDDKDTEIKRLKTQLDKENETVLFHFSKQRDLESQLTLTNQRIENLREALNANCYCEKLHPDAGGKCAPCSGLAQDDKMKEES